MPGGARTSLAAERGLASWLAELRGTAKKLTVASRISVAAQGVVALAASCSCGCSGGSAAGGPAAQSPAPAGSVHQACTASACVSLSRPARSIDRTPASSPQFPIA